MIAIILEKKNVILMLPVFLFNLTKLKMIPKTLIIIRNTSRMLMSKSQPCEICRAGILTRTTPLRAGLETIRIPMMLIKIIHEIIENHPIVFIMKSGPRLLFFMR